MQFEHFVRTRACEQNAPQKLLIKKQKSLHRIAEIERVNREVLQRPMVEPDDKLSVEHKLKYIFKYTTHVAQVFFVSSHNAL